MSYMANKYCIVVVVVVFLGFELVGRITKTLYADEISCGLRCLQDKKCQSYNSKSDVSDAKK